MKETEFKAAMEGFWQGYQKSAIMIGVFEDIGFMIDLEPDRPGPGMLFAIQDAMTKAVLNIFGIDDGSMLEELDSFLAESADKFIAEKTLPDEVYKGILDMVRAYGYKIPWENEERTKLFFTGDNIVRHKALSLKDRTPVDGYIWCGADHVYITPGNLGVSYDEETQTISAHAVEVDKSTVAASMRVMDDQMKTLYERDTVRTKDGEECVLEHLDPETCRLFCEGRHVKGLLFVKSNYE